MLPETISPTERYQMVCDERHGFHILLVVGALLGQPAPIVPLWVGTCLDGRTFAALKRWTGIRRDQWQQWGALAEVIGHEAFASHMRQLMVADPLEEPVATVVQLLDDPRELALGEQLSGERGLRTELLYRHRFASAEARDRFDRWFWTGENGCAAEHFAEVAYNLGTKALGALLDQLAKDVAATSTGKSPRSRRPRQSKRSAA